MYRVLLLLVVLVLPGFSLAQLQAFSFPHGGHERTYVLHVPSGYDPDSPIPLVLMLHGRYGSGAGTAGLTDFNARADAHGFLVVYPDAIDGEWNYPLGIPGYGATHDDTGFLLALVDHLAEAYAVDRDRLYVAGISNGGFMVQRLACDAPEVFAGYASVAAAGFDSMPSLCRRPAPIALLLMHGTEDSNIPWEGVYRTVGGQTHMLTAPVPETFSFWARFAGCDDRVDSRAIPERGGSPGTSVRVFTAGHCPDGGEIVLFAIVGGGHNWPGVSSRIPADIAGQVNTDIHATDVIWEFFSRHRRGG